MSIDIDTFKFTSKGRSINIHIGSAPKTGTEDSYVKYFSSNGIGTIIRCCESPSCDETIFSNNSIAVIDIGFEDGNPPSDVIIPKLDDIYRKLFPKGTKIANVFIHCQSGLGRAPTCAGYLACKYFKTDSVQFISDVRKKRSGSINMKQLNWLMRIKKNKDNGCTIM
jgi:hypothetical protein